VRLSSRSSIVDFVDLSDVSIASILYNELLTKKDNLKLFVNPNLYEDLKEPF
jgi:hypothetical protein